MLCIHMNKKCLEFNLIFFYLLLYIGLFNSDFFLHLCFFLSLKYAIPKTMCVYHELKTCYGCCYSHMRFLYLVFNKQKAKKEWLKKTRTPVLEPLVFVMVNYEYVVNRLMLIFKWFLLSVLFLSKSTVSYWRFAVISVFVFPHGTLNLLWFVFTFVFLIYWYLKCHVADAHKKHNDDNNNDNWKIKTWLCSSNHKSCRCICVSNFLLTSDY